MSDSTPGANKALVWIRRIVLTVVGIELGWIVVANLFLNTPIGSWTINRRPERWTVTWDRAWSPYPGRVKAHGVVYQHHIGRFDAFVRAENGSVTVPIRPLFERRFILEGIVADSARASLGRRPPQPPKPPAPKPPGSKPRKPGWHIEILDARVDSIEEFAFGDIAISGGSATASGSFTKQLGADMELRDIELAWKDARMRIEGSKTPAKAINIGFRGGMTPFNPRVDRGWASLGHLSGDVDVEGHILSLAPLQAFFSSAGWVNGVGGSGQIAAHLRIDKGRLLPESTLSVTAERLAVSFMDFEANGTGRVAFSRESVSKGDMTHLELLLDEFEFGRNGDLSPLARGRMMSMTVDALNMRMGSPAEEVHVVLDLPDSEMPDVAVLGAWLPETLGLELEKGRARLSARLESTGRGKPAKGRCRVRGDGLTGKFRDLDFRIDMDAEMQISGTNWNELEVAVDGTSVRFFDGDIRGEGVPVEPGWWMNLEISNGQASLKTPLAIEGELDLKMRDIRALIAVVAEVKAWLRKVDGILSVKNLEGHTRAKFGNKRISLHGLSVSGDRLACEGDVDLGGGEGEGLLWMKFRRRDLAFEWEGQRRDWKFYNDRKWFDKRRAERAKAH